MEIEEMVAKQTSDPNPSEQKKYTYDEVYKSTLGYFKGDELAARVWATKYALKDSFGAIYELNPDGMHWRITREIARVEKKYPNPILPAVLNLEFIF